MSVLKAHRTESRAEFVNTANQIYVYAIQFLSLASEVIDRTEKANSIYPSDNLRKELRKTHLLEARAALMALDVHLAHCYEIMMSNPAGCFSSGSGAAVPASNAKRKLENMAQTLGEMIDRENNLLTNVLKSDKDR